MPNINLTTGVGRPAQTVLPATFLAGNNAISTQITAVNSTGSQINFPVHSETNNQVSAVGDRNELHRANHSKQAAVIHQMLSKTFPKISEDMISSALCAGASGNLIQQEINYRPENSLILLSLLTQDEINREPELLKSAADLIKSLNTQGNKHSKLKRTLNNEERAFDKKMESVFKSLGDNKWKTISDRFVEKYVNPAIKDKLAEVFDRADVDSCNVNDSLVSTLEHQSQLKIEGYIQEYQQHGETSFADKALQLHNVFLELESKIEHIRSAKDMNNTSESAHQGSASNPQNFVGDDVDAGRPHFRASPSTPLTPSTPLLPSSTSHNENMYNTYTTYNTTNNYYTSPYETTSINSIQSNDEENEKPLLPTSFKSVLNIELAAPVVQTSGRVKTTLEIPNINQYQPQVAEKPFLESKPPVSEKTVKKEATPVIEQETQSVIELETTKQVEQPRKHIADIQWLLPKNTGFQNRYIRTESGWKSSNASESEVKPVVTTVGGLNRSQADKEIYQGLRTAPQVVPAEQMFADSIAKADELFTGTERGALRANQAEVERYNDNAKRFP